MKIQLLAFGLAKDILGQQRLEMELEEGVSSEEFEQHLQKAYPALGESLSIRLAVNETYVQEAITLKDGDEVALIPPVSGG